jgi:hypothetical protein
MPIWNQTNVNHLLARSLFGFSAKDSQQAMGYGNFSDLINKFRMEDAILVYLIRWLMEYSIIRIIDL